MNNNYCSLQEAWGIETFKQPKKKKRRKKRKKESHQNNYTSEILENNIVNKTRNQTIETMDNQELEGYNSSDYEQYEMEYNNEQKIIPEDNYSHDNDINNYINNYEPENNNYQVVEQSSPTDMDNVIMRLYDILERVENKSNFSSSGNIYDLILFMFMGAFILFIIDYMYKIGMNVRHL